MHPVNQSQKHQQRMGKIALALLLGGCASLFLWAMIATAAPVGRSAAPGYDPIVAEIITWVNTPTLAYDLAGLTGERPVVVAGSLYTIATRNSYQTEAISMATRYVYEQFASFGLPVAYHDYTYNTYHWRNVIAEKSGVISPSRIYVLTAHVDNMPEGALAPGADDNGSGSVAVLTAARLLAPYHFTHTLRFILFTGEEQGLRGSAAYAAECKARGEDVAGVINLDMIAYNSTYQPIIDLYAQTGMTGSIELTHLFSNVIGVYELDLIPHRYDVSSGFPIQNSDQWPFLQQGYPAFLAIEGLDDMTPYYHTVGDTLETLDLAYYADYTRASIAAIVHLGGLLAGELAGAVHETDTGRPLEAVVEARASHHARPFTTSSTLTGAYTLSLPAGRYTVTVARPLYYPAVFTDVSLVAGTVTTHEAMLTPWPRLYLPVVIQAYGD